MNLVADIHLAESLGWKPEDNLAYAVWQLRAVCSSRNCSVNEPEQYQDNGSQRTILLKRSI